MVVSSLLPRAFVVVMSRDGLLCQAQRAAMYVLVPCMAPWQVRSELPGRCAEVHQGRLRDASPPDRSTSHFHMQQHKFIPAETIDLPSVLCIRFLEPKTLMF